MLPMASASAFSSPTETLALRAELTALGKAKSDAATIRKTLARSNTERREGRPEMARWSECYAARRVGKVASRP